MKVTAANMSQDLTIELPTAPGGKPGKAAGASQQIRLCAESVSSMQVLHASSQGGGDIVCLGSYDGLVLTSVMQDQQ